MTLGKRRLPKNKTKTTCKMDNKNKKTEERQLDELEKFLLTHRSKLQKEEQKSIDEDFDASFSMEKNFLAIQAKIKNEQAKSIEPRNIIEERAKKLLQIEEDETTKQEKPKSWVKPSPIASTLETQKENLPVTKTVSLRKFWTVAASLTALLVTTFLYQADTISMLTAENEELASVHEENEQGNFDNNNNNRNYAQNVSLPAELIEAENYYSSIIAKDKKELKKKDTENWVTPETIQTLDELDEAYKVMKSDLLEEQNPKILIDEMLNNLKLRKQILEESILILEKTNSSDSKTNNNHSNEKSI